MRQIYYLRSLRVATFNFQTQQLCQGSTLTNFTARLTALGQEAEFLKWETYGNEAFAKRLQHLQFQSMDPTAWHDANSVAARNLHHELNSMQSLVDDGKRLAGELSEICELYELALSEDDDEMISTIETSILNLESLVSSKRQELYFQDEADSCDCYVQIVAGAGGTESCDWAAMLFNMYKYWVQTSQYEFKVIDESKDAESGGGFRSITMKISGHNAYGWMKCEAGVHRLVRVSPFDAQKKRHTTFAQLLIYPSFIGEKATLLKDIELKPSDLTIETKRASGAGGQHVNTTDSAVRITHRETGIVVSCQNERSQHQNKSTAMEMLKSRIWQHEIEKGWKLKQSLTIGQGDNSWGHQIRSLVLNPYNLVKDHRSSWESGNTSAYLKGELIQDCMTAHLNNMLKCKHK